MKRNKVPATASLQRYEEFIANETPVCPVDATVPCEVFAHVVKRSGCARDKIANMGLQFYSVFSERCSPCQHCRFLDRAIARQGTVRAGVGMFRLYQAIENSESGKLVVDLTGNPGWPSAIRYMRERDFIVMRKVREHVWELEISVLGKIARSAFDHGTLKWADVRSQLKSARKSTVELTESMLEKITALQSDSTVKVFTRDNAGELIPVLRTALQRYDSP